MGIIFIIYGLVIGSFLNVVIFRIPAGLSIVKPPSQCGSCGTRIRPIHLVPVFSYVFLRGKCAYCHDEISPRYPLIEALNALIYFLLYLKYGMSIEAVLLALFSSVMLVVAMIDYDNMDVYLSTLIPGGVLAALYMLNGYLEGEAMLSHVLTALTGMGFILLVILVTRGGMGGGDIWILGLIGLILGPLHTLLSFFLTSIIGGALAVFILLSGRKKRKEGIPFGPLLIIGFYISLFFGSELINAYLSLLNIHI